MSHFRLTDGLLTLEIHILAESMPVNQGSYILQITEAFCGPSIQQRPFQIGSSLSGLESSGEPYCVSYKTREVCNLQEKCEFIVHIWMNFDIWNEKTLAKFIMISIKIELNIKWSTDCARCSMLTKEGEIHRSKVSTEIDLHWIDGRQ